MARQFTSIPTLMCSSVGVVLASRPWSRASDPFWRSMPSVTRPARRTKGIVRHVLKSGTKSSLLVRAHRPAVREYRIERTIPNPPLVRDDQGQVSNLSPEDVLPRVEVFGQHEISDFTEKPREAHAPTRPLRRAGRRHYRAGRADLRRNMEKSRRSLLDARVELRQIEERLAALPGLEETLERFREAGLEERLKEQSLLVREERVLDLPPSALPPSAHA